MKSHSQTASATVNITKGWPSFAKNYGELGLSSVTRLAQVPNIPIALPDHLPDLLNQLEISRSAPDLSSVSHNRPHPLSAHRETPIMENQISISLSH